MAKALEIGIGDLLAKLLTHTDIILRPLKAARTIPLFFEKPLTDTFDDCGVLVERNFHRKILFHERRDF